MAEGTWANRHRLEKLNHASVGKLRDGLTRMKYSILILVTHLLGVGHLTRAAALGRGLAEAGHRVKLVTGGRPAPLVSMQGMEVVQLTPVHCKGADFTTLLDDNGTPMTGQGHLARITAILEAFSTSKPDIVITETFPFGRKQLAQEFMALLHAAHAAAHPVTVLSSIRDILNPPSKPARVSTAEDLLAQFYHAVLVHGDAAVTPLSVSWPTTPALERIISYTGYIAEPLAENGTSNPTDEIVVSGGGSAASLPLFRAAIGAAAIDKSSRHWRILVGHGATEADFQALAQNKETTGKVTVERARTDFQALLSGAAASVSQAGYNTMIDIARANIPSVIVPFEQGKEEEQYLRAARFSSLGLAECVREKELTSQRLAQSVEQVIARKSRPEATLSLDGVAGSVTAIHSIHSKTSAVANARQRLDAALQKAGQDGRTVTFWWRDDDAVKPSPALDRLLELARRYAITPALAVIPALAEPALAERLVDEKVDILVHGHAHTNHAPPGAKKQELGYRPVSDMASELMQALARLRMLFGEHCLPVLVPPWNRVDETLLSFLKDCGFKGISTYGSRRAAEHNGMTVINTHCDPVDWHGHGGLADEADLLDNLAIRIASDEPLGILTHHLVHDAWHWAFLDRLFEQVTRHGVTRFASATNLFRIMCR